MRRLASSLLLAIFVLPGAAVPAEEDPDPAIERLLTVVRRDDDPEAWTEAVDELRGRGGDAADRLTAALEALRVRRTRNLSAAARRIRALAERIGEGEKQGRSLAAWDAARTRARDWIFSGKSFPDIEGAIFGPQEGYEEALALGKAAIRRYRALASPLARALAPLSRLTPARAEAMRREYVEARRALSRVSAEIEGADGVGDPGVELPPLASLLLEIHEEKYKSAAAKFRELPAGWIRLCVFEAYGRALLARNARDAFGQSKNAVRAIASLNRYRMALGNSPLSHNPRLARMAGDHSREQSRLGYLGHDSPVPANRTMRDRSKNAGYEGWVEECVSGRSDPGSAVETWKWDGGHHRIMVRETHAEVGIGHKGPCTLNAGSGEPGSPPSLRY